MQIELHDKQTLIDQLMNKSVVWVTNKMDLNWQAKQLGSWNTCHPSKIQWSVKIFITQLIIITMSTGIVSTGIMVDSC